jgi:hypothetical protein
MGSYITYTRSLDEHTSLRVSLAWLVWVNKNQIGYVKSRLGKHENWQTIETFNLIYTWTVAEGGGDDVWRTLGRLRRERRKSRDVTALPTTAVFVTVPVCSELHSAVIIFHLNDARNLQKTSKHFYNKKSLKNKPLITVLKWIYKNEKLI